MISDNGKKSTMKKILHVTESLGGGVATALKGYVQSSPDHWHFLLATKRDGAHDKMTWLQNLAGLDELPRGFLPAVQTIRAVYKKIQPDWVHLHSSFAGGYGRLAFLPRRKVIYTPHCYAFERRDIDQWQSLVYRLAEQVLCLGSSVIAATSPRELGRTHGFVAARADAAQLRAFKRRHQSAAPELSARTETEDRHGRTHFAAERPGLFP